MTKQEKQIPKLINDHNYMMDFFNARIKEIDKNGVKALRVDSHNVKAHFDNNFFHYVIYNNLTIETKQGLRKRYIILCISFSGHGRKKMYQTLDLVYKNGFNKGEVIVPRPLWYIDELMAAFYVGLPGDNLLEHIKNGYLNLITVKKIANGLSKLHQIIPSKEIKLKQHSFSPAYLDPTNVINLPHNRDTFLSRAVLAQFRQLKKMQPKMIGKKEYFLSHGDFHPENMIINRFNNNQIAIIDFSESCLAPVYYDIASFLQQLEFMTMSYLSPKEYGQIEYIFISSYFNKKKLEKDIKNKINLYKAWTALKSTVYFMIFKDEINHRFAEHLLTKSEDLYRQIKI